MKLREYRQQLNISAARAAEEYGVSVSCWNFWETGSRIPRPDEMKGIFSWSNGNVTPNDFYDLDDESETGRANGPLPCLSGSEVAA